MREQTILRKMRQGDPEALNLLMDRYIPYVSAIVWNILGGSMTAEDAEEVVSDVFLAAWNQAEQILADCVKGWLGAVARNKAKSKFRRLQKTLPLEEDVLEIPDDRIVDEEMERAEATALVHRAVDTLKEPDREIFLRHYFYAQSIGQISRQMCLNESTVKSKLSRGRARLKTVLLGWGVR